MLQFLETGKALYVLAAVCALGILSRWLARNLYKRLIRETDNITLTKNKNLRSFKQRAESTYRMNQGVPHVQSYLERQMYDFKYLGVPIHGYANFSSQMTILCFLLGGAAAFGAYWYRCDSYYVVLYGSVGIMAGLLTILADNGAGLTDKKQQLFVSLENYLENNLFSRLEKERIQDEAEYREARETARSGVRERSRMPGAGERDRPLSQDRVLGAERIALERGGTDRTGPDRLLSDRVNGANRALGTESGPGRAMGAENGLVRSQGAEPGPGRGLGAEFGTSRGAGPERSLGADRRAADCSAVSLDQEAIPADLAEELNRTLDQAELLDHKGSANRRKAARERRAGAADHQAAGRKNTASVRDLAAERKGGQDQGKMQDSELVTGRRDDSDAKLIDLTRNAKSGQVRSLNETSFADHLDLAMDADDLDMQLSGGQQAAAERPDMDHEGGRDIDYLKRSLEQIAASREKPREPEGEKDWLKDLDPNEMKLIGDILKQYLS